MGGPKIKFYVDIISPFAYLAMHILRTSPVFQPCEITYVPVLLGGILKATGNTPPLYIKNKVEWISKERVRWVQQFNIPIAPTMPNPFPVSTVAPQRTLVAVSLLAPEKLADCIHALYCAYFIDLKNVSKVEDFSPALESVLGEDMTKEVLEKSTTDEVKKGMIENTEAALADGAFGLPWFVATNSRGQTECYWGFDHLGQVADHLGLEKPKPGSAGEGGWKAML